MKCTLEHLILYLEDELDPAERTMVEQQLKTDASLRNELDELKSSLRLVQELQPSEEPGDDYFRTFYNRLQPNLVRKKSFLESIGDFFQPLTRVGFAGGMAAMVAAFVFVAIGINALLVQKREIPSVRSESISIKKNEEFMSYVAADHLRKSELLLREVYNISQTDGLNQEALEMARVRGQKLLSENRSYRQVAVAEGDEELSKVLKELEIILVAISNMDPEDAEYSLPSVKRAIRKKNLLIKIEIINLNDLEVPESRETREVV